jgi:photosystem II stability/assembly factor-like uncharacterized protein
MKTKFSLSITLFVIIFSTQFCEAQFYEWRTMNSPIAKLYALPSNPSIIFAGDQSGLIRKSIDKGLTWKLVSLKSETPISDLSFFDNTSGLAIGSEPGTLLITRDAGETWSRKALMNATNLPVSLFETISKISIVNSTTAYLHFGKYEAKQALITRDAGLSFDTISVPGEIFKVAGDTLVSFGYNRDMFGIKRFSIYKSINAGSSWSLIKTSPTGLVDFDIYGYEFVYFLNSNVFYMTAGKSNKLLFKTTDGGNTFTTVTKPQPTNFNKVKFMHFSSASNGFAVMENDFSYAYSTTDAGLTWIPSISEVKAPAIYTGGNTFIAMAKGVCAYSTDNGQNFSLLSSPIVAINQNPTMNNLKVLSNDIAYAEFGTLYEGCLVKTKDGGLTWKKLLKQNGNDFRGSAYAFRGEDTLFYSSGGNIYYTSNAGFTNTQVFQYGFTPHQIKKIEFIDANHAVAYAYGFTVFSSNAGQSWTSKNTNISEPIDAVFPSINAWYMLAGAKVYKSIDTGTTWLEVTNNINLSVGGTNCNIGLYFKNAMEGFVYGCNGRVYKTIDGASSWIDIGANLPQNISYNDFEVIRFKDNSVGYASDPGAGIMYTNDGGTTWAAHGKVQGAGATKIEFVNSNTAAMLGSPTFANFVKYVGPQNFEIDTITIGQFSGVSNVSKSVSILVYPNPASDLIKVNTEFEGMKFRVLNLVGTELISGQYHTYIDISSVPSGIYILMLENGKEIYRTKFYKR